MAHGTAKHRKSTLADAIILETSIAGRLSIFAQENTAGTRSAMRKVNLDRAERLKRLGDDVARLFAMVACERESCLRRAEQISPFEKFCQDAREKTLDGSARAGHNSRA